MKIHAQTFGVAGAVFFLAITVCGTAFVSTAEPQDFQKVPIILRASEVLPRDFLSGPNYTVREMVRNDGFVNTYELDTQYGPLKVESTVLLLKRINELRVLSQIEDLRGKDVYLNAAKTAALGPVKTAGALVTDPVGTASGVASGIGNFFSKASAAVTSSGSQQESLTKSVLGQAASKREFANQFGVDPYTTYEPLKKALNDLAWTAAAGGLTVKAAISAIPGGAVIGYAGTAGTLKEMVRDKTPAQLQKMNRNSLGEMGVPDGVADVFLLNASFDPYEQTLLVGELASMTGVRNRNIFIERSIGADEEPVALFLRMRAQLMGRYHGKTRSAASFVDADGVPVLLTKNGVIVGIFPLDHVAWTAGFAQKGIAVSDAIDSMKGIKGKEIWITGTVDPVARKALEEKGWKVEDRVSDRLLK